MNPEEVKKMQGVTTNYDLNHQGLQGWEQGDTDAELKRARRNAIIFTMYNK